jgi:hypothetical protein
MEMIFQKTSPLSNSGSTNRRFAVQPLLCKEVIHLQVPLQVPCVNLARLAVSRFDSGKNQNLILTSLGWLDGQCVQETGTYSPCYAKTRLLGNSASRGRVAALDPDWDWI